MSTILVGGGGGAYCDGGICISSGICSSTKAGASSIAGGVIISSSESEGKTYSWTEVQDVTANKIKV